VSRAVEASKANEKGVHQMKLMFRSMLSLAAVVLAASGVAATSASAHEWLLNKEPVTASTPVMGNGEMNLFDSGIKERLKCSISENGTVTTEGKGSVTEVTLTHCTRPEVAFGAECESEATTLTASAVGLPWKTKIIGREEPPKIFNEVQGQGFSWKCKNHFGGFFTNKCTAGSQFAGLYEEFGVGVREEIIPFNGGGGNGLLTCEDGGVGTATLRSTNHMKAEHGTLNFR
jgi:hypothetical protein